MVSFSPGVHRVSCSSCHGANDLDYKYCKFCGGFERREAAKQKVQANASIGVMDKMLFGKFP